MPFDLHCIRILMKVHVVRIGNFIQKICWQITLKYVLKRLRTDLFAKYIYGNSKKHTIPD